MNTQKIKNLLLIGLFINITNGLVAQGNNQGPAFSIKNKLSGYYPVSPTSARLMEQINFPVDYSIGAIDVTIPIYTIKTRDFTLPITLKCKTTGIKESEAWYSWAGIGWTLNAEPTITREIRGKEDENGYLKYDARFDTPWADKQYLLNVADGSFDSQPDIFYYKTLTNQGKFIFKRPENRNESGLCRPIFMPSSSEKIDAKGDLYQIKITDESGNLYTYGGSVTSNEVSTSFSSRGTSTWKATSIVSPQLDSISFAYQKTHERSGLSTSTRYDFYGVEDNGYTQTEFIYPYRAGYWRGTYGEMRYFEENGYSPDSPNNKFNLREKPETSTGYSGSSGTVYPVVLKNISYSGGHVEFETSYEQLSKIKIYEGDVLLLSVDLVYNTSKKNQLVQLVFTDEITTKKEHYLFGYAPSRNPVSNSNNIDYWGYYNSHTENRDLVPRRKVAMYIPRGSGRTDSIEIGGANREADMQCYVNSLQEIVYPSGETDNLYFTLNRYRSLKTNEVKNAGGLRIQRIETSDADGNTIRTREFKYGYDANETGKVWIEPFPELFEEQRSRVYYTPAVTYRNRYRVYSSNPFLSLFASNGASVLYDKVTETIYDNGNTPIKKTEYFYDVHTLYETPPYAETLIEPIEEWECNQLLRVNDYDLLSGTVVKTEEYQYSILSEPDLSSNNATSAFKVYMETESINDNSVPDHEVNHEVYINAFTIRGGGRKSIEKKVETIIEHGDAQTDTVTYQYGESKLDVRTGYPIAETTVGSDGRNFIKSYEYPYHKSESVFMTMVDNNVLNKQVTEKYTVTGLGDGNKEQTIVSTYQASRCGQVNYKLSSIYLIEPDTHIKEGEKYLKYDNRGNITSILKDNVYVTLIWGYDYQHPVAEIVGANASSIISDGEYTALQRKTGNDLKAALQDIRNRVVDGTITTFTWYPTRGLASKTDPMGITTYYEYDGYGRLLTIRDNNKHITDSFEYNKKQ